MYCLSNICHVCLEKTSKLISNINSLSVNKDIIHLIGYLPLNLAWLKTKRNILVCEQCCLRLRETCQFLEMCLKTSALLQGYMDKLNTTPISNTDNEAKLLVYLNTHNVIDEVKREIQSEDEEKCTFQWHPNIEEIGDVFVDFEDSLVKEGIICKIEADDKQEYPTDNNSTEIIEETEDVFVNINDYFVREENTCKREEVDTDEYSTGNNFTDNIDNESDSEIPLSDNANITNTDGVSSTQANATNKNDLNTAAKKSYKCSTCSKFFFRKSALNIHTRMHTNEKSYECAICNRCFSEKSNLVVHMRVHTGEKPYECSECKKCFAHQLYLVRHVRIHTGEKPYQCSECKKCFTDCTDLGRHMRIHTGEKPFECSKCKKCFTNRSHLVRHMGIHTGEKPYHCIKCKKSFSIKSNLVRHMRTHIGE